ncbi:MAG: DUF6427 family protein [Dysgonamonadaceae bacterium]|jgi:hypothetical protein|nr:DUF6427 family protein [Dysgonamonadaceae bacterium]
MIIDRIHGKMVCSTILLLLAAGIFAAVRINSSSSAPELWTAAAAHAGIAVTVAVINRKFNIIRSRTLLPAVFFLLLSSINREVYENAVDSLIAFSIALSSALVLGAWQQRNATKQSFTVSVILTVASLFRPPVIMLLPVFWFWFFYLKSWNRRIIPASVLGFAVVYLFIFTWCVWRDEISSFTAWLPRISGAVHVNIPAFSVPEWIFYGTVLLLSVIAGFRLYLVNISESFRTVSSLKCLWTAAVVMFAIFIVQPGSRQYWSLIVYIPLSILLAWCFAAVKSRVIKCVFLVLTVVIMAVVVYIRFSVR